MCGRTRNSYRVDEIRNICNMNAALDPGQTTLDFHPVENFSPGRSGPVVTQSGDSSSRCIRMMTWGLIPSFSPKHQKLDHFFMFNCRVETIAEKRSFKSLLQNGSRCVVVQNGFYEWAVEAKEKRPYYISDPTGAPMIFAALFDEFVTAEGEKLITYTILTSPSCSKIKFLHHRQPIRLLTQNEMDIWLNPHADLQTEVMPLVNNWSLEENYEQLSSRYACHPVTPKMNSLSYQEKDCHLPIKVAAAISSFFGGAPKLLSPSIDKQTEPKDFYDINEGDYDNTTLTCEDSASETRFAANESAEKAEAANSLSPNRPIDLTEVAQSSQETNDGAFCCPVCNCELSTNSAIFRKMHVKVCTEKQSTRPTVDPQFTKKRKTNLFEKKLPPSKLNLPETLPALIDHPSPTKTKKAKMVNSPVKPNSITNYFSIQSK